MKKGDRVVIKDKGHPWYGHSGVIKERTPNMPGMYVVDLDNGMSAGCYLYQLEKQ